MEVRCGGAAGAFRRQCSAAAPPARWRHVAPRFLRFSRRGRRQRCVTPPRASHSIALPFWARDPDGQRRERERERERQRERERERQREREGERERQRERERERERTGKNGKERERTGKNGNGNGNEAGSLWRPGPGRSATADHDVEHLDRAE